MITCPLQPVSPSFVNNEECNEDERKDHKDQHHDDDDGLVTLHVQPPAESLKQAGVLNQAVFGDAMQEPQVTHLKVKPVE